MSADVMSFIPTSLVLMIFSCFCVSSLDIRLPPSIVEPPIESKIFRPDESITLTCVATGIPEPEYEWLKDNVTLTNVVHVSGGGTIHIETLSYIDEGVYQCVASNQHGKTLSPPTVLRRAVLSSASTSTQPQELSAVVGEPLMIPCVPAKCFPKPTYSWALSSAQVSSEQTNLILSRRIQIDEDGNLHFAHVMPEDAHREKLYKCNTFNPFTDVTMGGSYTKVTLTSGGDGKPVASRLLFATVSPAIALEGKNISLRCFFSGSPEPRVSWSPERGTTMPRGRSIYMNYDTELLIHSVVQSDEGTYICQAGAEKHSIRLDVHAVPVFRSTNDQPHNVNVTNGDNVTVVCNAYADPPATVTWFINGMPLDQENLPPRLRIAPNNTQLTMLNVCRDCPDGSSDIKVIQCNASNIHGAVFRSGYVNVLKKTEMTVFPDDITVTTADSYACFNCSGDSDDSTPVSVKWYKLHDKENLFFPVVEIPGQVVVGPSGSLSFRIPDNSSSWTAYAGRYKCVVSNEYSEQSKEALLQVEDSDPPVVLASQAEFPWWILLIILLVILLILLLICCCCYLHRNKGETYPVDEKERKNGHNPEKELADSGFQDYVRPEHLTAGSRASLASTRKTISDDEMSLNEYGDIDAGKFTEDGSFIGDYGDRAYV